MKITLSWLKEYLKTDSSLTDIIDALTSIGLEVEDVDDRKSFLPFKTARILSVSAHPNADKLNVLSVDVGGSDPVQVVCGATNVRVGLIGVFAEPGTWIPGIDILLSTSTIRGVESFGMLCSERELLISNDHDGIIELPEDTPIGASYAAYMGLDDPVIDISITPNRSDCTSIYGIARDLSATGIGTLVPVNTPQVVERGDVRIDAAIVSKPDENLCFGFSYRVIHSLKNGRSPQWLRNRLNSIGMRSTNFLVDITNYISFAYGRPLHAFDAHKIKGNIVIRRAKEGETFKALDHKCYSLSSTDCVIVDDEKILAIAGIIGGLSSGCDENTVEVLLESANWNPVNVARTGRRLNVMTEARYRFERGIDLCFTDLGLDLATKLILENCSGFSSFKKSIGFVPETVKTIDFYTVQVEKLLGVYIAEHKIISILEALGFKVDQQEKGHIRVTVPSWRHADVSGEADLVEEVMRIYGVDKIPSKPSLCKKFPYHLESLPDLPRFIASMGGIEIISWSFISQKEACLFGGGSKELKLKNPISSDCTDMRPSLLPGLLAALKRNIDRSYTNLTFFEVGNIYLSTSSLSQEKSVSVVRQGTSKWSGSGRSWNGNIANVDLYDAKTDALAILSLYGFSSEKILVERGAPDWYHPGRSGVFKLGPRHLLGYFGEIHPKILEKMNVSGPICGCEIFLDRMPSSRSKKNRAKPTLVTSPYQPVKRDFSFLIKKSISMTAFLKAVKSADKHYIQSVKIFDIFENPEMDSEFISVGIEIIFQSNTGTLLDAEIERLSKNIVAAVSKNVDGVLRF